MSKHTKQDWLVDECTVYALNAEGSNRFVAQVQGGWTTEGRTRTDLDELRANARLMGEALNMLEEMKRYLTIIERAEANPELWAVLSHGTGIATANGYRAAISNATGESE